jgi:hypothetical protein
MRTAAEAIREGIRDIGEGIRHIVAFWPGKKNRFSSVPLPKIEKLNRSRFLPGVDMDHCFCGFTREANAVAGVSCGIGYRRLNPLLSWRCEVWQGGGVARRINVRSLSSKNDLALILPPNSFQWTPTQCRGTKGVNLVCGIRTGATPGRKCIGGNYGEFFLSSISYLVLWCFPLLSIFIGIPA